MMQTCSPNCDFAIEMSPSTKSEGQPVEFVTLLPLIRQHAQMQFRELPFEAREEAVAETIAHAFVSYVGLLSQGKTDRIAATPLAKFATRRVRCGRRVGTRKNVNDVSSPLCQLKHRLALRRLDHFHEDTAEWKEILVEDRHTTPAEIAITRIDFRTWLAQLPSRLRDVAEVLATGETTSAASRLFGVSMARISQLRVELRNAWQAFQGELPDGVLEAA